MLILVIGGIIKFASQPPTIAKWVLSRPFQSRFTEALHERCDLVPITSSPNKCLRPREIRKSNQMVVTVVDVFQNQFLNPFDEELRKDSLYNLVSGMPVDNQISECLTSIFPSGTALMKGFAQRLHQDGSSESLNDTIKKFPLKNFEEKAKVSRNGNQKEIRIQRDILAKLVSLFNKHKSPIDIDAALSYPLAPVSLSLFNADGSIRKTNKSSLFKVAMSDLTI